MSPGAYGVWPTRTMAVQDFDKGPTSTPPPVISANKTTAPEFGGPDYFIKHMKEVNMDNIMDQFKQGYKTSEFWLSLLGKAAVVVGVFGFELDTEEIALLISVTLGTDVYGGWRTFLKRKRIEGVTEPTL